MAGSLSITFGTVFSFILGTFWILAVMLPWNWLRSDNAIVSFEVNLFTVKTSKGLGTAVLSGISSMVFGSKDKFSAAITEFIDGSMSIQDAKANFCIITIFNWCDQWEKAFIASWIMCILGLTTAAFFIGGGASLYFYGNVHATETGRCLSKFFLILGPLLGLAGITAYSVLTMEFGKSSDPIMNTGSHSYWGPGWIVAVTVTVLSWIPVYILFMFCRADPLEKKHGDDDESFMEYGAPGTQAGMQAAAPGYGSVGYGAAGLVPPQPQPVMVMQQQAPGFGLPPTSQGGHAAAW